MTEDRTLDILESLMNGSAENIESIVSEIDVDDQSNSDRWTWLHRVHLNSRITVPAKNLSVLVAASKNLDASDKDGRTPLHHAVRNRQETSVKILLMAGANPNVMTDKGVTPLQVCVATRPMSMEILQMLLQAGADPDLGRASSARKFCIAASFPEKPKVLELFESAKPTEG